MSKIKTVEKIMLFDMAASHKAVDRVEKE